MTRLLYLIKRRAALSLREFDDHWWQHHIPRFGLPRDDIRRYVVYRPVPSDNSDSAAWDAAVSIWVDDDEALATLMGSVMTAAGEDERRFIDHASSMSLVVDDQVVREPDHRSRVVLFEALAGITEDPAYLADRVGSWIAGLSDDLVAGTILSQQRQVSAGTSAFTALGATAACPAIATHYFSSVLAARTFVREGRGLGQFFSEENVRHALTVRHVLRHEVR